MYLGTQGYREFGNKVYRSWDYGKVSIAEIKKIQYIHKKWYVLKLISERIQVLCRSVEHDDLLLMGSLRWYHSYLILFSTYRILTVWNNSWSNAKYEEMPKG